MLVIFYPSLGIVQETGGDEGFWGVMLFYPLIVVAPAASVVVMLRLLRRGT
jgi:hypothetical protein